MYLTLEIPFQRGSSEEVWGSQTAEKFLFQDDQEHQICV